MTIWITNVFKKPSVIISDEIYYKDFTDNLSSVAEIDKAGKIISGLLQGYFGNVGYTVRELL